MTDTTTDRPKAFSYLRFSTPEQMKGDSFRRQTQLAEKWADQNGVALDDTLKFHDLGVSAYRGANTATGQLRDFVNAVEAGLVPPGSFLLVESLDRISRQAPLEAVGKLSEIIRGGVTVVTLIDGRRYSTATMASDNMSLLTAVITFIRANEESATKARRLAAAWENKRATALEKPITARCPSWLRLDKQAGAFEVIDERAAVVRRVYQMALEGVGKSRIAETLNAECVPRFGRAAIWQPSYIHKLLESPAVVGTYIPTKASEVDGKQVRRKLGPIPDYFPAVVDQETFALVQSLRAGNRATITRGTDPLSNLLAGLLRCPECGGTMTRITKGSRARAGKPYLLCVKAKLGAGCRRKYVGQEAVEAALIGDVDRLVATAPSGDETVEAELVRVENTLDAIDTAIANVLEAITSGTPSLALTEKLREMETERDTLRREHGQLADRAAAASGPLMEKRLADLRAALTAQPLDKLKANTALKLLLASATVDYRHGVLDLEWKNGGRSEVTYAMPEDIAAAAL